MPTPRSTPTPTALSAPLQHLITQVFTGGTLSSTVSLPSTAVQAQIVPAHPWGPSGVLARLKRTQRADIDPQRLVAQRYALVPNTAHARFLVPLRSRAAALASLLRYNRLRDARTATARAGLAAVGLAGGMDTACDHLVITVASTLPAQHYSEHLLLSRLQVELQQPSLCAGIGVRPLDPNSKPTLQLFTDGGKPAGYAKIGWNQATRALVDNEAATLRALPASMTQLHIPTVRWSGTWQGRSVTVTSALPAGISRHPNPDKPPVAAVLLEFAGQPQRDRTLVDTDYWQELMQEVPAIHDDEPDLGNALSRYLMALRQRHGQARVAMARWHGDWVPWNMGYRHDRLYVWDWEHSHPSAPLGFDLAHWWFQVAFVLRQAYLAPALAKVRARCAAGWPELDLSPSQGTIVADLYLAELARRTSRLHRGGGGWNPGLYPALLAALSAQAADLACDPSGPAPASPSTAGDLG